MLQKIIKYIQLYAKSMKEIGHASSLLTVLLFVLIAFQAILPLLTILCIQAIVNQLIMGYEALSHLLIPVAGWIIAYGYTSLAIPLIKNVEGILSDRLIEHVNVSMMKKSKELQEIALFEDADFYNDLHFISEQASWRPINLVIFGSGILQFLMTLVSLTLLIASYSPWLAILLLFAILPNSYFSFLIQQDAFESMVAGSEEIREMRYYSDVLLSSEYAKEARIYHYFDFFIQKYQKKYQLSHQRIMKSRYKKMRLSFFSALMSVLISLISILWFISEVMKGNIMVGSLVAFANALSYMNESAGGLVEHTSMLYDTLLYMEKYFDFMNRKDDVQNKETCQCFDSHYETIHFSDISFQYPHQQAWALSHIDFVIHRKEKIAIVGENGSGKTTLIKILCRFYPLQSGNIYFDQMDITDFDLESYRREIAAVFQDFGQYDLTLQENIGLGNLEKMKEELLMKEVIHRAGLTAFFERIHENLHQMLGTRFEDAVNLSGGEWQKLAIARALLADREMIFLDEPTASLDPRSEYEIYQRFLELVNDKTVFFITHRLAAVKMADRVLVLKNGQLHGFDTHENLMQSNEYYREMYEMQAQSYQ